MARSLTVGLVGLSHKTAPIEVRERLALGEGEQEAVLKRLRELPGVEEALVVSTCNRLEVYLAGAEGVVASARNFFRERAGDGLVVDGALFERENREAVAHLFEVAASLDSMVVGEPQILGQLKEAYASAQSLHAVGGVLSRLFQSAFSAAKRVRTETAIGSSSVSMASIAAELAQKIFDTLVGRTVLLVGAGEMSELTAKHLTSTGTKLIVTNRTFARAEALAEGIGGTAAPFERLPELLKEADIIVTSTASIQPIFTPSLVQAAIRARHFRPLFFIDLAVPRDVAEGVGALENVYAYNVDDLDRVADAGRKARAVEAQKAHALVAEEVERFSRGARERGGMPVVARLRGKAEAIAALEVERTLTQFGEGLTEKQRHSIEAMGKAIVNKLLHGPTVWLRNAVELPPGETEAASQLVSQLFELDDPPEERDEP